MKASELLLYLSCKYDGDWHKLYQAIKIRENVIPQLVEDFAKKFTTPYVTIVDEDYPSVLKECHPFRFVLSRQHPTHKRMAELHHGCRL